MLTSSLPFSLMAPKNSSRQNIQLVAELLPPVHRCKTSMSKVLVQPSSAHWVRGWLKVIESRADCLGLDKWYPP
jgi:hypothetical protein